MLIVVLKRKFIVTFFYNFRHTFVPYDVDKCCNPLCFLSKIDAIRAHRNKGCNIKMTAEGKVEQ